MNIHISHESLIANIKKQGAQAMQGRQVIARLKKIIPQTLQKISSTPHSPSAKKSFLTRQALTHPDYLELLDNYSQAHYQAIIAKIEYETHYMLYLARQSLAKHRRNNRISTPHKSVKS